MKTMSKQDFIKSHKDKLSQIYMEKSGSDKGFDSWLKTEEADKVVTSLMKLSEAISGVENKEVKFMSKDDSTGSAPYMKDIDIFSNTSIDKQFFIAEHRDMLEGVLGDDVDLYTNTTVDYLMNAPEEVIQALSGIVTSESDDLFNERGELLTELPFDDCEETMKNIQLNDLALSCIQSINSILDLYVEAGDSVYSKEGMVLDLLVDYIEKARKAKNVYESLNSIIQG